MRVLQVKCFYVMSRSAQNNHSNIFDRPLGVAGSLLVFLIINQRGLLCMYCGYL